jgi:hypothetical protein
MLFVAVSMDSDWFQEYQELDFSMSMISAQSVAKKTQLNHLKKKRAAGKKDDTKLAMHLPAEGCEGTIMLIRHCEKGDLKSHCDFTGFERAAYLATQFGNSSTDRWPPPSNIYALGVGHRHKKKKLNFREVETVETLAHKFGLAIDQSYSTETMDKLAKNMLASIKEGEMCGKLVIVSWKHSDIARLARHLGT